jgi:sulfoxide reductase heme-binding subunit YedZ
VTDPRLLWWVDRSSGLVSLVLLTVVMGLGVVAAGSSTRAIHTRVASQSLHRSVALVATVLLAVHIGTAVADSFVPLRLVDVVVPFQARYRPLWIGFGTLAIDLLVVLLVTSLLRRRLGRRAWRAVHLLAYGLWPVAIVHALGSGSDVRSATVQAIGLACLLAVLLGATWRLLLGQATAPVRVVAIVGLVVVTTTAAGWAATGPLASGWAHKAAASVTR